MGQESDALETAASAERDGAVEGRWEKDRDITMASRDVEINTTIGLYLSLRRVSYHLIGQTHGE